MINATSQYWCLHRFLITILFLWYFFLIRKHSLHSWIAFIAKCKHLLLLNYYFSALLPLPVCWYRRAAVQRGLPCSRVGWRCGTFPFRQCPISQSGATRRSDASPGSCKHLSRAEEGHTELKRTIIPPGNTGPEVRLTRADGKGFFTFLYEDPSHCCCHGYKDVLRFWEPSKQRLFKASLKQIQVDAETCSTLDFHLSYMGVL